MTIDEVMVRLRRELEETHGVKGAAILLDRPPGGWSALVTNATLDAKLEALEQRLGTKVADLRSDMNTGMAGIRAEMQVEIRAQTWRMATLVIAAQGVMVAALTAIGAALRFA